MSDEAVTARTRKAPAAKPAKKPYFEKAKEAIATLDDPEALRARLAELEGGAPAEAAEPAPEPSRSRTRSEKAGRRARGANDLSHKLKLGVNERNLDLENFEYRWINGGLDDQRFHDKTRVNEQGADWTPLTGDGEVASDTQEVCFGERSAPTRQGRSNMPISAASRRISTKRTTAFYRH